MASAFDQLKYQFQRGDNAVVQLIIINVAVFLFHGGGLVLLTLFGGDSAGAFWKNEVYYRFALPSDPAEFIRQPWSLITYGFSHSMNDFWHIVMNMLILFWMGRIVMEFQGAKRLVNIYILGLIGGGILYLILYNTIPRFSGVNSILVGASGAVYAVTVAAAVTAPNYTLFLLILGPVRLKWIAAVLITVSFLSLSGSNAGGQMAHLGGAFVGWLYISQLRQGRDLGTPVQAVLTFFANLFRPKSKIKVSYRRNEPKPRASSGTGRSTVFGGTTARKPKTGGGGGGKKSYTSTQEEIDAILDKIGDKGYESLTKEEKQRLFEASKK